MHLIIHGHFYQPPRENPWLGVIEKQPDAAPFHDWNQRIAAECYIPNTISRVLDRDKRIDSVVNNFEHISFNAGPTLAAWLARHEPAAYARMLAADRESARRLGGHGNAMAQAYSHAILPLASPEDKRLQVAMGIEDFRARFGREAEGMWLPETAVNDETLCALVEAGIRFTILAPHQGARVRRIGSGRWHAVKKGSRDTTQAYRWLYRPPGRRPDPERFIDLILYDHALSHAVGFEHLLRDGECFAQRIVERIDPDRPDALLAIATDGETFGHHEPFADMCLAYFLERLAPTLELTLTNPGQYLEEHPPTMEIALDPGPKDAGTSWSCPHGVERWRADCGCGRWGDIGWNQAWRAPLREAVDGMRARVSAIAREHLSPRVGDVERARIEYAHLATDHDAHALGEFAVRHLRPDRQTPEDRHAVLIALEADRASILSLASCGWFFEELSRWEPLQNITFAYRAAGLVMSLCQEDVFSPFLAILEHARSNTGLGSGRDLFMRLVAPRAYDMTQVAAACGIGRVTTGRLLDVGGRLNDVEEEASVELDGPVKRCAGLIRVTDAITGETGRHAYAACAPSIKDVRAHVRPVDSRNEYEHMAAALAGVPSAEVSSVMGARWFGWPDLPVEVREWILPVVLAAAQQHVEEDLDRLYQTHRELMETIRAADMPIPAELATVAQAALGNRLRREVDAHRGDWRRSAFATAYAATEEADALGIDLQDAQVAEFLTADLVVAAQEARADPVPQRFTRLRSILDVTDRLGIEIRRYIAENIVIDTLEDKIMKRIRGLRDVESDRDAYEEILAILEVAERMNISRRRYLAALAPFAEKITERKAPSGTALAS